MAEESPAYLMYLQGGKSSYVNGAEGMTITRSDPVLCIVNSEGGRSQLVRAGNVTGFSYPPERCTGHRWR